MKMTNPLAGIQAYQQAPSGIQAQMAQLSQVQQQPPQGQVMSPSQQSPDQSQLAMYIKQLQDNGASDEQINNVVQQIQNNGGQLPDQSQGDVQGGIGTNTISGGDDNELWNEKTPQTAPNVNQDQAPQQSPLSHALNQMSSGQGGNINYDQVGSAYPTPRTPIVQDKQQLISNALMGDKSMNGASLGMQVGNATAAANQIQAAQQQAYQDELNKRDLGAYNSQFGIAKEAGSLGAERARNEQTAKYQEGELGVRKDEIRRKEDAEKSTVITMADGSLGYIDSHHPENGVTPLPGTKAKTTGGNNNIRRLPEGTQNSIYTEIERQTGMLGSNGKPKEDAPYPLADEQRAQISDDVIKQLQNSPDISVPGAVTRAIAKLGGAKALKDQTTPGELFGTNPTGYREFPQVKAASPQTTPNVAQPQDSATIAPTIAPNEDDTSPDAMTPMKNGVAAPRSKSEYDTLPSGTKYIYKDGSIRTKP